MGEAVVDERAQVRSYLRAQLVALACSAILLTLEVTFFGLRGSLGVRVLDASFYVTIFAAAYLVIALVVFVGRADLARAVATCPATIVSITCALAMLGAFVGSAVAAAYFGTAFVIVLGWAIGALYCLLPMIVSGLIGMLFYLWSNEAARKR